MKTILLVRAVLVPFCTCCVLLAVPHPALGVEKAGDVVAVRGKAVIARQTLKVEAAVRTVLLESDSVATQDRSRVKMLFRDDSVLTLGANSKLIVRKYLHSPESKRSESIYELADGRLRAVVGGAGFKVTTPTAFAAARGTVLNVVYHPETGTTEIAVLEGLIEVRNINTQVPGSQLVKAGQSTMVTGNRPPTAPKPLDAQDRERLGRKEKDIDVPELTRHGRDDGILHEVSGKMRRGGRLTQPIEQEPVHASSKVSLGITFPR